MIIYTWASKTTSPRQDFLTFRVIFLQRHFPQHIKAVHAWRSKSMESGIGGGTGRMRQLNVSGRSRNTSAPHPRKGLWKEPCFIPRKRPANGMRTTCMHHPYFIWIRHGQHPPVRPWTCREMPVMNCCLALPILTFGVLRWFWGWDNHLISSPIIFALFSHVKPEYFQTKIIIVFIHVDIIQ